LAYEKIKPGVSWGLADEYLPELFDADFHNSSRDGLEEFDGLFELITVQTWLKPEELALIDVDHARVCVAQRVKSLMEARALSQGGLLSADDVSWIEYAPPVLRLPLTKFLCSVSNKRLRRVGLALWDYLELHYGGQGHG
jgi:hypothetical protein